MKFQVKATDHEYFETSEERCSRCRNDIGEEEVPLLLWRQSDSRYMYIFCEECTKGSIVG